MYRRGIFSDELPLKEKNKLEQISKLIDQINKKEGKNMISLGMTRNKNEQADAIAFSSL